MESPNKNCTCFLVYINLNEFHSFRHKFIFMIHEIIYMESDDTIWEIGYIMFQMTKQGIQN